MNALKNKIKSQRGASITFALLLFLVCAVISSVVIVAGTTAAGRMSQTAEFDRRYYAVTSAAKLLKSDIDGKTLEVTYTDEPDGGGSKRVYHAFYKGETNKIDPDTILSDASKRLAQYLNDKTPISPKTFNLTTNLTGAGIDLNCTVVEKIGTNGLITFRINNNGTNTTQYRVEIVFASNRKETVDAVTGQKKIMLEWKFHSMKKVRDPIDISGGGGGGEGP